MKKGLIITTTLAMALGVGVAVGAHRSEAKIAKAYGNDDAYWYVAGSFNSWTLQDDATHLTYSKMAGNNWEYESDEYIEFKKNDEFKFVYSWGGTSDTTNYLTPALMTNSTDFTGGNGSNFVASRDIKVKFFLQIYGIEGSWMGVYWEEYKEPAADPVYTVKNRNNTLVEFVLDEENKPEGVKHQYSAELQYALRGGELKFYADGVQITEHIGVDAGDEENVNNVYGNTTDGFRIRHTYDYSGYTKVYLKTYEDGGYSIWGDGYDVDFFSVTVKTDTTTAYNLVKDETFEPNETYIEQFKTTKAVPMKAMSGADWDTSNGIMCDGLAPDVAPEAVAGNNAMAAFQATAWKVHNDCEEVIYLKIKRTDLSTMMYIGGYEETHALTIGGKTVNLSNNGDGQYVAHGVALAAGDEVTSYTIEGVAQTVTSKRVANNNLTEDKKVVANVESADIYYNVEAKTLWISGLPAAGQHLLKNGNTAIEMTHTEPFEDYDQYATGKLTFAANDTFKLVNTGADDSYPVIWCPETVVMSKELTGKFTYDSTNKEVKCVSACSAAVYLKIKSGVDEVYLGDVADYVDEAIDYANGFKSAMAGACSAEGKKAAVEAAWGAQATAYAALSAEAKVEVKKGNSSIVDEIQEFAERYVSIKQQHPDWNLENFLEWDIPNNGAYRVVTSDAISENSTMIIIIAIAATSAIALGTLLIIKKRKHQ